LKPRRSQKILVKSDDAVFSSAGYILWNVSVWMLAWGAFVVATVLSYREVHYHVPNDLRSPAILAADALLAAAVAFGFAIHEGTLRRWADLHLCFRFGLWSAAVFRLVPPILNEQAGLFLKNCGSFDLPYIVLGAVIHGGLVIMASWPYAIRVVDRPVWTDGQELWQLCGTVVLIFFVMAAVVRLLSDSWR
jgi:hypothetical protein